ncbi:MAG TPA: class I SAM-dependent methyltransferase [Bacteroidetes bacterium]|nr:class I SAM-dependent methyltransferase [Bacteroidota bacterium]
MCATIAAPSAYLPWTYLRDRTLLKRPCGAHWPLSTILPFTRNPWIEMKIHAGRWVWDLKSFIYKWLRSFFVYDRIYRAEIRPFRKWLTDRIQYDKKYLDLGAGSGDSFAVYPKQCHPAGLDFSLRMLKLLRKKTASPLVQGDAAFLPFKNGAFAGITAIGLVEYVDSLPDVLSEIHRILQPDGWLAVTISQPNGLNLLRSLTGSRLHLYSIEKFKTLVSDRGFQTHETNKTLFQYQLYLKKS